MAAPATPVGGLPSLPLELTLADTPPGHGTLRCERVLRALPGKRLVCLGTWGGRAVLVKIFLHRHRAKIHWRREWRGVRALLERGIATAPLLHAGSCVEQGWPLLVTARIDAGENLWQAWHRQPDPDACAALLDDLVALLAQHHAAGLRQTDLHLDNFLLADQRLYTLDGDGIVARRRALGRRMSLRNLAQAFAQLPPHWDAHADRCARGYARLRGWPTDADADAGKLLRRYAKTVRAARKSDYLRKVRRTCSAFVSRRAGRLRLVCDRAFDDPELRDWLSPDGLRFRPGQDRMLKDGNTCTVWLHCHGARELVVKRYNIKGWRHRLNRCWRPTRASLAWRNAHLLIFWDLPTARPVALVEERHGPLRGRAWLVSEHVPGPDCAEHLRSRPAGERPAAARKIAALLARLAALRISHGDLKASNILVRDGEPVLLDLDDLREHHLGPAFARRHRRDRRRLLRNWQDQPECLALMAAALDEALPAQDGGS